MSRRSAGRGRSASVLASVLLLLSVGLSEAQQQSATGTRCGLRGLPCCGGGGSPGSYGKADSSSGCEQDNRPTFCSESGFCVACGFRGSPCCPGGTCENPTETTCNAAGFCETTCGARGLPCCPSADDPAGGCGFSEICVAGVCATCGEVQQPCCEQQPYDDGCRTSQNTVCDAATDTCLPPGCGTPGQRCCTAEDESPFAYEGGCEFGMFCDDGSCTVCGYLDQQCCPDTEYEYVPSYACRVYTDYGTTFVGGPCGDDNTCQNAIVAPGFQGPDPEGLLPPPPLPEGCGEAGLRCCGPDDNSDFECQTNSYEICVEGLCTSCGGDGFQCCEGESRQCEDTYSYCNPDNLCSGNCGFAGERCCADGFCLYDTDECDGDTNTCVGITCGMAGQRCCAAGERGDSADTVCDPGTTCVDGACATCGFDGLPCCPEERVARFGEEVCQGEGAECGPDGTCIGAVLFPRFSCGDFGYDCCPGDVCATGTVCIAGTVCRGCGREGQQCCPSSGCDGGGECVDDVCGPRTCGETGMPCCSPDEDRFECVGTCVDGMCVDCAGIGQPCCTQGRTKCADRLPCIDDICVSRAAPLPPPPAPPPLPAAAPPATPP